MRRGLLTIPNVNSENAGNGGGLPDDVGLEDDLQIAGFPVNGGSTFEFSKCAGIGQKGSCCFGTVLEDTGNEDHDFAGVWIEDTGDDRVIDIAGR